MTAEAPTTGLAAPAGLDPLVLGPYVPVLVSRRLGRTSQPLLRPERDQVLAAVLFADISGFTALAERLGQRGPAGTEQLTSLLNGCLGQLVASVTTQGGDVLKFAGDGLLALWPAADGGLEVATARAAGCALMMQARVGDRAVGVSGQLSMRIGVGAGPAVTAQLGGVGGRWELLVAGSAVEQVMAAEGLASPGDVMLSSEAFALLGAGCEADPQPAADGGPPHGYRLAALTAVPAQPAAEPPPAEATATALRGYVLPAVLARLDAGQSEWLSEHRRISTSFIRLPGLGDTDDRGLERAHGAVGTVQQLVGRYGGTLNKLSVDDKGATLLVAFGLPPLAHEDDAARALEAALAIREALGAGGLGCSVGVATGRAFCGVVGSSSRREYTVIGDVVNRAARLMQRAEAEVLCDAATRWAARARVAFEPLATVTVKGRVEPVQVFRPCGRARRDRPSHEIVGRAAERAVLAGYLDGTLSGHGAVVLIEGEAGIGKSRVVLDLVEQARTRGVRAVVGVADAVESATPYLAWRGVVDEVLDLPASPELRREQALARLGTRADLAHLAPLLNDVVPLGIPATEVTEQMEGQVRADNTRALLVGLLEVAAAQGPLVVVLEDAHWLDSASWAVAWRVAQRLPNVLLVLALRPPGDAAPAEYWNLRRAPGARLVTLNVLVADDTTALVCQRLGIGSIPDPVAALIRERGEGNPLFTEELAYALRDAGSIVVAGGECRLAPDADLRALSLPETVEGVVMGRIDRLAPAQQVALKVASVVGHVFGYRIVRDIHPIRSDVPALAANLDSLVRCDLTVLDSAPPDAAWSFRHATTREVSYNLMLFAQRRELHRAAARWYERNHRAELARFYPLLAHHWKHAEVPAKATRYQALSGEQALSSGSYQEAVHFLEAALSLGGRALSDRRRRARWERQLGEAYLGLGRTADGQRHLMAALALLGAVAPDSKPRVAAGLARQFPVQVLHRLLPARLFGRGKARAELLEAARAYIRLVEVYWFANDTASLVHAGLRALNIAERASPSAELARAYAIMCLSAGSIPLHRLARAYARKAIETARAVEQLWPLGYARFITSVYAIGTGAWQEIEVSLAEAARIFERLGDRRLLGDTRTVCAMAALYQGDLASAERTFCDVAAAGSHNENVQHQVWGCIGTAECQLGSGRPDGAARSLEAALTLLDAHPDPAEELRAHGLLAVARLRAGDEAGARRSARAAAGLVRRFRAPTAHYLLEGYAGIAEVWLSLWESGDRSAETRRAARSACASLRRFARVFPIGKPRALLWTGRCHWLSGRPARARATWRRSLATAQRLAMPPEAARARNELARHRRTPPHDDLQPRPAAGEERG